MGIGRFCTWILEARRTAIKKSMAHPHIVANAIGYNTGMGYAFSERERIQQLSATQWALSHTASLASLRRNFLGIRERSEEDIALSFVQDMAAVHSLKSAPTEAIEQWRARVLEPDFQQKTPYQKVGELLEWYKQWRQTVPAGWSNRRLQKQMERALLRFSQRELCQNGFIDTPTLRSQWLDREYGYFQYQRENIHVGKNASYVNTSIMVHGQLDSTFQRQHHYLKSQCEHATPWEILQRYEELPNKKEFQAINYYLLTVTEENFDRDFFQQLLRKAFLDQCPDDEEGRRKILKLCAIHKDPSFDTRYREIEKKSQRWERYTKLRDSCTDSHYRFATNGQRPIAHLWHRLNFWDYRGLRVLDTGQTTTTNAYTVTTRIDIPQVLHRKNPELAKAYTLATALDLSDGDTADFVKKAAFSGPPQTLQAHMPEEIFSDLF